MEDLKPRQLQVARLRLFNIPSIFPHYLNWLVAPNY